MWVRICVEFDRLRLWRSNGIALVQEVSVSYPKSVDAKCEFFCLLFCERKVGAYFFLFKKKKVS